MEEKKNNKKGHQPIFQIKFHYYRQIDTRRRGQEVHSATRKEDLEAFIYSRNRRRQIYQGIVKLAGEELWKKEVNVGKINTVRADFLDILVLLVHLGEIGALRQGDLEKEIIFSEHSLLFPMEFPLEQERNYRKKLENLILESRGEKQPERCVFLEKLLKLWDSWKDDSDYLMEQYPKELEEELREQLEKLKEWEERISQTEPEKINTAQVVPAYRWNKAMEEYGILY